MAILDDVLAGLADASSWGYHEGSDAATEPAALAALALLSQGLDHKAQPCIDWLLGLQNADGSLGINAAQSAPSWPTGWAVLAWHTARHSAIADARLDSAIDRAVQSMLQAQGLLLKRLEAAGHDTTIKGWPWVEGTHSWLEPTAINVLALKQTGHTNHPRTRDGVRLLQDRLLVGGGCNYGNTVVLGQELRPHLQPTGFSLLALAGEPDVSGRIGKSIEYLERELSVRTATESLCYGLLGLAAHGRLMEYADAWLLAVAKRTLKRDAACYKLALLALAWQGAKHPLIPTTVEAVTP